MSTAPTSAVTAATGAAAAPRQLVAVLSYALEANVFNPVPRHCPTPSRGFKKVAKVLMWALFGFLFFN